ncbi:MAG TPA: transcription-repair coupling factor, partial [Desulfuromonadales bacterium]|nr:transcription-repair coupling factor [Desulfuromonadales bacterium]
MEQNQSEIVHATVRSFLEGIRSHAGAAEITGLVGSSASYLLEALAAESSRGPLCVLTADQAQARRLFKDLQFFAAGRERVFFFPQWEVAPYEPLSPHPEIEATRLATLTALHQGRADAVVMPVRALLQKVIPREVLSTLSERLLLEEEYERRSLTQRLLDLGYHPVPLVEDRGTFSFRGDILDIYPPTLPQPVRIDFFGDFIERIRPFDPASQRSRDEKLGELVLTPSREMVTGGEHGQTLEHRIKERGDALNVPRPGRETIVEELREGIFAPGREFLLPLNYEKLDPFFTYLDGGRWAFMEPPEIEREADTLTAEAEVAERNMQQSGTLHAAREDLYLTPGQMSDNIDSSKRIDFATLELFRPGEERENYRFRAIGNADLRQQT